MTHFSTLEEEALIYGWVIASNDPIHGKDQKGAIFWGKIMEEYNKRKGPNGVERDRKALRTKCNTLRAEMKKYISYIRPYFRSRSTGMTEEDYVSTSKKKLMFSFFHFDLFLSFSKFFFSFFPQYRRGRENYVAAFKKQWMHESIFKILKTYQPYYNPVVNNDDGVGTSTQPSQHTQTTEENEVDNLDEEFQNMARFGSSSSTHISETSDISKRRRYFEQTDDVRSEGRDQAKKRARELKHRINQMKNWINSSNFLKTHKHKEWQNMKQRKSI